MNSLITAASTLAVILVLIVIVGCRRTQTVDKSQTPAPDSPYVKIYVGKSGELTLDGRAVTLEDVRSEFAALAQKKGVVLYHRESPEEAEPHANAGQVIDLVIQNRLPIRMCMSKDCSDAVDENGKLRVGN